MPLVDFKFIVDLAHVMKIGVNNTYNILYGDLIRTHDTYM